MSYLWRNLWKQRPRIKFFKFLRLPKKVSAFASTSLDGGLCETYAFPSTFIWLISFMASSDLYSLDVLYPLVKTAFIITHDGEIEEMDLADAALIAQSKAMLVCHAKWTKSRLGIEIDHAFDVMTLFAFMRPARFCLPTPTGLASAPCETAKQS